MFAARVDAGGILTWHLTGASTVSATITRSAAEAGRCLKLCSRACFFFNDTATTEIYTLSLHDALPISPFLSASRLKHGWRATPAGRWRPGDRKSTRLNSSHGSISYAVFCLKKTHR